MSHVKPTFLETDFLWLQTPEGLQALDAYFIDYLKGHDACDLIGKYRQGICAFDSESLISYGDVF